MKKRYLRYLKIFLRRRYCKTYCWWWLGNLDDVRKAGPRKLKRFLWEGFLHICLSFVQTFDWKLQDFEKFHRAWFDPDKWLGKNMQYGVECYGSFTFVQSNIQRWDSKQNLEFKSWPLFFSFPRKTNSRLKISRKAGITLAHCRAIYLCYMGT